MRENTSGQGLIDRTIQDLLERLVLVLMQVLPHSIEDDDRIVQGVANHREYSRNDRETHFKLHDPDEDDGRQDVMSRGADRRQSETPLETVREIRKHREEREENGEKRFLPQLATDLRAD